MCILCIEFQKGKMTLLEAKNNLREMIAEKNAAEKDYWHWVGLDEADDLEKMLTADTSDRDAFKNRGDG